ncbi:MAG: MotA/TolQ/ExbB proton channel family protein [Muribaculaceae bacterium]|nr:MotA/TolQ/ExbB proton channel family protein [Muribaculaceae bacterium]
MESLSEILFALASGLMYPVMILLLAALVYALVLCVVSFVDYNRFISSRRMVEPLLDKNNSCIFPEGLNHIDAPYYSVAVNALISNADCRAARERYLAETEIKIDKRLSRPRMLVKLGPMLGLMGTLIPMGPALTRLAAGDISSMAYNMEVAFATTVVGILIAAIGLVTLQAAKRSCAQLLIDLEYINQLINSNETE